MGTMLRVAATALLLAASPCSLLFPACKAAKDWSHRVGVDQWTGESSWNLQVIVDGMLHDEGSVSVDGHMSEAYTDCDCVEKSSRALAADTVELISNSSPDPSGERCYYSLEWTFSGPFQYLGTCLSGSCQSNGKQEMLWQGSDWYGSYSTWDYFWQ